MLKIIIPEKVPKEEREEIEKLKKEFLRGENINWDEIKKELL